RVGRCDTHAHDGSHQRGDGQRGAREEQEEHNAGDGCGQRRDDDEGVEPRLEVDDYEQVDEHDGEDQAKEQTDVGAVHRLDLAAHVDEVAASKRSTVLVDDALYVMRDGAEIAVLHVGVDIERAADVVVRDDWHFRRARECGYVGEDFGACRAGGGDGDVLQVLQRLDAVLRALRDDVVDD